MKLIEIKQEQKLIFDDLSFKHFLPWHKTTMPILGDYLEFNEVSLRKMSVDELEEKYKKLLKAVVHIKEKLDVFRNLEDISKEDRIKYQKTSQALMEAKQKANFCECLLKDSKVIYKFKMKF
jgi:uncharacterized protein YozE (UPF0346 family)